MAMPARADLSLRMSENIQGNVLSPFNKPCQRFVFLSFMNNQVGARSWLGQLVNEKLVATTKQVFEHGKAYRDAKEANQVLPTEKWVGVSFTSSGLVVLDPDKANDLIAFDAFWQGALVDREFPGGRRMSPAVVGDAPRGEPVDWVVGGTGQYPVDAVVTLAADDPDVLDTLAQDVCGWATDRRLTVLAWQDCRRVGGDGPGTEPFGFPDGISQPGIRGFTEAVDRNGRLEAKEQAGSPIIAAGEFVLGYDGEGGSYPDVRRYRTPEWMRDGSFQVCLRLRQDVEGWKTQMRELSESSDKTFDAAATAIGRRADGTPLAATEGGNGLNDFQFEPVDLQGVQNPRFPHIHKMNPRDGGFASYTHRLLRRGIPFATPLHVEGPPPDEQGAAGQQELGLVFNAFMASIENQFEFLVQSWASNPDSLPPVAPDGPDPVIGVSDAPCFLQRAKGGPVEIHFGRFVWTSGAVYAFAPSLSALAGLAGLDADQADGA